MPVLTPGKPVTIDKPMLLVENKLSPGRYRFQLVVTDSAGNDSAPSELVVTVSTPDPLPPPRTGPVLRPDVVGPLIRPRPVVEPIDPRLIRPIRRPQ